MIQIFIVLVTITSSYAHGQFFQKIGQAFLGAKSSIEGFASQAKGALHTIAPPPTKGALSNLVKKLTKFSIDKDYRYQVLEALNPNVRSQLTAAQQKIIELADNSRFLKEVLAELNSLDDAVFEGYVEPEVHVQNLKTPARDFVARLVDDNSFRANFLSSLMPSRLTDAGLMPRYKKTIHQGEELRIEQEQNKPPDFDGKFQVFKDKINVIKQRILK